MHIKGGSPRPAPFPESTYLSPGMPGGPAPAGTLISPPPIRRITQGIRGRAGKAARELFPRDSGPQGCNPGEPGPRPGPGPDGGGPMMTV